jgi:hypothetical protein
MFFVHEKVFYAETQVELIMCVKSHFLNQLQKKYICPSELSYWFLFVSKD